MIEHAPWIGDRYRLGQGIDRQLIAIVGHSHYREAEDSEEFTVNVLKKLLAGRQKFAFFTQIQSYFGFNDTKDFWHRVMFFNYLPECVGSKTERYKRGTKEQIQLAKVRFRRLLDKHKPDKVLVFSNASGKGWETFPETDEEVRGERLSRLGSSVFSKFTWGTYTTGKHTVYAYGLRHPQGANKDEMKQAVKVVLDMKCGSTRT